MDYLKEAKYDLIYFWPSGMLTIKLVAVIIFSRGITPQVDDYRIPLFAIESHTLEDFWI